MLPRDERTRRAMLKAVVGVNNIPNWLGGRDTFEFDSNIYYSASTVLSDDDAIEYTKKMPYHA